VTLILEEMNHWNKHRILGTDIDDASLAKARAGGPYRPTDIRNVPSHMLEKYFTQVDGNYIVIDRIKRKVQYQAQDLLNSNYHKEFDLILCRNVVIYFTGEAKMRLNRSFYQALKPGGVLFIGGTETMLDAHSIGFERMSPCFFRKPHDSACENMEALRSELRV
jgi:chemotaxis protein methyltransferase CheR